MKAYEDHATAKREGHVLVVDDVATTRAIHSLVLGRHFEVKNASSGQEALDLCAERLPDLILLDVEMPGLDGFATCRKLRESTDIPIIFATAHESLDEHLKAFDAGGTDLCVKPVSAEILIRKVRLAIAQWRERAVLKAEKESLQVMAEQYQSSISERKLLLQFVRSSLGCDTYERLAQNFLHASQRLNVQCCIAIRTGDIESAWSLKGEATELERAVLAQIAKMGRIIQFKNRLALNHGKLSVVVSNMPDENSDEAKRIRENMHMLVEMAAALADNFSLRLIQPVAAPSAGSVDEIHQRQRKMIIDVRLLLQDMLDNLDATFDLMSTDKHQEERISHAVREPLERIFTVLDQNTAFNETLTTPAP